MKNSKWIWTKGEVINDMYGEFADKFDYCGGKAALKISADSNYAVFVNGKIADSGQYADYPYHKIYDELDITSAESKATYQEIKDYVLKEFGLKVSTLYISQIKRKCGIDVGEHYNISQKENQKVPQCPKEKEDAIRAALEHLAMI